MDDKIYNLRTNKVWPGAKGAVKFITLSRSTYEPVLVDASIQDTVSIEKRQFFFLFFKVFDRFELMKENDRWMNSIQFIKYDRFFFSEHRCKSERH